MWGERWRGVGWRGVRWSVGWRGVRWRCGVERCEVEVWDGEV